jgi:hypothetical protein
MRAESLKSSTRKVVYCYVTACKHGSRATKTRLLGNGYAPQQYRNFGSGVFYWVNVKFIMNVLARASSNLTDRPQKFTNHQTAK